LLNAWTSSNQYAFLAIVMHYVSNDGQLGACFLLPINKILYVHLQRSSSSIFTNLLGSIRVRTWQMLFGKHWNCTSLLEGYVYHSPMMYFANVFTDHRYRNGQRQQQQYADKIAQVTMPAARHLFLSTRCSHAMHASYNSSSSD